MPDSQAWEVHLGPTREVMMAWERRGKAKYYTRSRRVRGRMVRDYLGIGRLGEMAAELDAGNRLLVDEIRSESKAELDTVHPVRAFVRTFDRRLRAWLDRVMNE